MNRKGRAEAVLADHSTEKYGFIHIRVGGEPMSTGPTEVMREGEAGNNFCVRAIQEGH